MAKNSQVEIKLVINKEYPYFLMYQNIDICRKCCYLAGIWIEIPEIATESLIQAN